MNIIKKITISALLSLSAFGLTASLPAFADGASDAVMYCTVCHDGITVNGAVIGGGAKLCAQRSTSEWITTIDRMNSKGCAVPAGSTPCARAALDLPDGVPIRHRCCLSSYQNLAHTPHKCRAAVCKGREHVCGCSKLARGRCRAPRRCAQRASPCATQRLT